MDGEGLLAEAARVVVPAGFGREHTEVAEYQALVLPIVELAMDGQGHLKARAGTFEIAPLGEEVADVAEDNALEPRLPAAR